jgi:MFS family permease
MLTLARGLSSLRRSAASAPTARPGVSDRRLLYASAFLRALATGFIGVLLGVYLDRIGHDAGVIGVVASVGLAGAAAGACVVTFWGDRIGYRRSLLGLTLASSAGGVALALASHPLLLASAAFVGMANAMGRDRGGALVLELAALPATADAARRTAVFARYNVLQDVGHALGGLLAGLPALLEGAGLAGPLACRSAVLAYAALMLAPAIAYLRLSGVIEPLPSPSRVPVSPQTRRMLWRISSLFALDSLAGGFLTSALLAFFFYERFGVGLGTIAPLFFAARLANAVSHVAAAWLASRIGLVNTMVFTHIPSSLLLVTVAYAPSFSVAAALFLLREALVEMDVPTRQSYVMALVRPEERGIASGVTHLVRLAAWAIAPAFAGQLTAEVSLIVPLLAGAALKICYDLALWRAFRHVRPPEEQPA